MSWQVIAKKDLRDSIRSRGLWGVIAVFLALNLLLAYLIDIDGSDADSLVAAAGSLILGILFFIPLAGLFLSVKSIARERESGTINLLLSLPHTRGEMVLGKFVGRSAVMSITVLVGFLPVLLYLLFTVDSGGAFELVAFLVAAGLFGLMFIGIGVGLSALVNSETQATLSGVLIFFVLYLWPFIFAILDVDPPDFLNRFYLLTIFGDLVATINGLNDGDLTGPSAALTEDALEAGSSTASPGILMQNWFVVIILALWIAVPLLIGYYRFERTDL